MTRLGRSIEHPGIAMARWAVALFMVLVAMATANVAHAVTAIEVGKEQDRIDINALGTPVQGVGDQLQIETAPGADGLTDRMSVPAVTRGTNPQWFTFALRNVSDTRVERWLTADRYNQAGSGIVWPRLDARQIENVTPSIGFLPENLALDGTDAFRLTVEPGQTVTFVVELATGASPRFNIWRAFDYEKRARNKQLLFGVLLGITGLLAIFLSAVFAANHKMIFPAAALFTWCVLAYLCVDFGFWHKLFAVRPEDNAQYRAATEAGVAASLLVFIYTFLRLGAWEGFARLLLRVWIVAQLALVAVAFLDPRLAATFARLSIGGIFAIASLLVVVLALRLQDRALSLVPVWILLGVWISGTALLFAGRMQTDAAVTALTSGLVLIVLLIGFTVTQYAFRSIDPVHALGSDDQNIRLLALENSGASTWEWTAKRDEIKVGAEMETTLGLTPGDLHASAQTFLERMHPVDRDRLRQALDTLKDTGDGELRLEFRMRHVDSDYRWFMLEAATDPGADKRRTRCVGLVRETTDGRSAQERFVNDSIHDAVTNLPNRALFRDRLMTAMARAKSEPLVQPVVIVIDVDRFGAQTTAIPHFETDGLLITLARRLAHLIGPGDTLARIAGDRFGVLLVAMRPARELHMVADSMRVAVRSLIKIGGSEMTPTAAVGYALYDRNSDASASDVLDDAEIAMHRARRQGRDTVLAFTPDLRTDRRERAVLEAELREAIGKRQLILQYQPIYVMRSQQIAGFEAVVHWDHPRLGKLDPAEIVPRADESDLIVKLGSAVVGSIVADLQRWQAVYDRPEAPLYVSVNLSRRQMIGKELADQIRSIITGSKLPRNTVRLEVSEGLVMENPEHATNVLGELIAAGAGLALDDFGTGYTSLTYLNVVPFDTIKVDHTLVHGSSDAGSMSAILRSVVTLAHELGKKVVAEGIDNEQDAAALKGLGCEYAQGLYYGGAQTSKQVIQVLKETRKLDRQTKRSGLFLLKERKIASPPRSIATPADGSTSDTAPGSAAAHASAVGDRRRGGKTVAGSKLTAAARLVPRPDLPPGKTGAAASAQTPGKRVARPLQGTDGQRAAAASQSGGVPVRNPTGPAAVRSSSQRQVQELDTVARAASASFAELGAQMASRTAPVAGVRHSATGPAAKLPPTTGQPRDETVPTAILQALAKSIDAQLPPTTPPVAQRPPADLPPRARAPIDLSTLPPGIAASLARLAGKPAGSDPEPPASADEIENGSPTSEPTQPIDRFARPNTARG